MSLRHISTFSAPERIIEQTRDALWRAGRDGFELFVLWSGVTDDPSETFKIRTAHTPSQRSYKTRDGLLVRVEGAALHSLNVWLYEHSEVLGVQIHAHPTTAFHSETDDAFPIVAMVGGLSIVVPNFAKDGLLTKSTAGYRLSESSAWERVKLNEVLEVTG